MFRHYCDILSELAVSTLRSYTNMSNSAVGNTIYDLKLFHTGFILLKSQCLKIFKIFKLSYL